MRDPAFTFHQTSCHRSVDVFISRVKPVAAENPDHRLVPIARSKEPSIAKCGRWGQQIGVGIVNEALQVTRPLIVIRPQRNQRKVESERLCLIRHIVELLEVSVVRPVWVPVDKHSLAIWIWDGERVKSRHADLNHSEPLLRTVLQIGVHVFPGPVQHRPGSVSEVKKR